MRLLIRFHKNTFAWIVILLSFAITTGLHAQSTGSIRGTVNDATGAAIPQASVAVTSDQTGLSRTTSTNDNGLFVFPDLPIGGYTIQIEKAGFQTQKREEITLLTGQTLDLNISLSLGSQSESITVTSGVTDIETTTSNIAVSVDQKQMQDLPLNGRNPLQLTTLTPGAALTTNLGAESGQQDNQGLTVNGLRTTQNNYQLDGAVYVNRFFESVPVLPNPDALQEFTIQASNFSAQHAGAGALVQLSSRSGTDKIHGNAYEFFRNTVLNSRNYFQQTVPPFKLNQFGGTVGGPIHKDKTFFFFSAEDLQQRSSPNPISIQVPTASQLNGDFSGLLAQGIAIFDPMTGKPFPGNIISRPINPLSNAVAQQYLVPLAANPVTGIFSSSSNSNIDQTQYLVKIDHRISERNHLSGRYFYVQDNFQRPFNAPLGFYAANKFRNQSLIISDTHIFSNTLTATFSASAGRFARTQIPIAPGMKTLQDLGQNVPFGTTDIPIFPGVRANISGFVNIFSGGALTNTPTSFEYKAEAVKVLGRHTIAFGGGYERARINSTDYSFTPGSNTFNGQRTAAPSGATLPAGTTRSGSALADFYLGLESGFFQDNGRKAYLRENRPALFIQDDFKVNRELTLNLGIRWEPWLPPVDLNNTLVGFETGRQSVIAPNAPSGLVFKGDPGQQDAMFRKSYKVFAPRLGFAYNVAGAGKTVIHGAYGLFYGLPAGSLYMRTVAAQPVDLYLNVINPPDWRDIYAGYPGGDPFPRAHLTPDQFHDYKFLLPFSGGVLNPLAKVGYTQSYNVAVEQQFGSKLSMMLAYVGNRVIHVMGSRQFNPAICPSPGVIGVTCTAGNEDSRRLHPGLGAVELADSYIYADYNSLQFNVSRRVKGGLTVLSNIVWSKSIDNVTVTQEGNAGPPNPFNLDSSRGPADFDQKIRFNTSLNYTLPKFNVNPLLGAVVNGWQANAILNLYTGLPFTIQSGTDRSLSGVGSDYADVVPGVSPSRPSGTSQVKKYFNTAAFAPAALGTFGNVSRNSLRGPGYANVDASLFKELFKEKRIHGQFRAEVFNMLNHTNFNNPISNISSGTFGQITTAGSPRVFQFGAKVMF